MIGKTVRENAIKTGEAAKKAGLAGVSAIVGNPSLLRIAECLARFAAGWLLSGAVIFHSYAPFSAGFVAVSGGGLGGLAALAGVVLGSVMRGGMEMAIKYSAIALLVFAASLVLKGVKIIGRPWFMPMIAALMTACTGAVYVANGGWQAGDVVFYIMDVVLAGGSAYFYALAFSDAATPEQERRRLISAGAAVCTLLIALSDVELLGVISIGRTAAVIIVLAAAYKGRAPVAAVVGIALGTSMDAAAGSLPFFCAALGLAGTVAGLFAGNNRLISAVAYILVNTIAVIWFGGGHMALASLYETFIASVAFILLPERLLLSVREGFSVKRSAYMGEEKAKEYVRKKAILAAEAFSAVYESLSTLGVDKSNKQDNVTTVFDATAERKCFACDERERCYGAEYEQTHTAQNDASVRMILRGELLPEDLPDYFRERCRDVQGYIKMINEEYIQLLRRRERLSRANEGYELICGRFLDMSDVFTAFSEQLVPAGSAEKELEERLNLYLRGKNLDVNAAVFRDGNSRMHIELDGEGAATLKKLPDWLDKLAAVIGKPICEMESESGRRHIALLEAEPLAVRIGVASMRRSGEDVSGDKGAYFKTDSGLLYVILSDGMGSGEGAAQDSGEVISILEKFLRAGVTAECAMRLVGATMQIKNEQALASASVDLLCVNLFSGQADIFKFGAAPTFVKNSAGVSVHKGSSLSAGLRGDKENLPDHLRTRLEAGSTAIIVSDGVTGGEDAEWLGRELEEEDNPGRDFARRVLEEAGRRYDCADDMTVITVNVEKR
ncbi:MAG: SpoIIE family protein phosphatase [Clostridiales bacterium]|nr:SpoIIE family protein phosphatase [Clostridiales bacterium]